MIKRDKWKRMSKMGFYNDRVAIADVNGKEIYLIRKQKNKLLLHYYSSEGEIFEKVLADNLLGEFDILIQDDNSIYLIYQDIDKDLNQIKFNNKESETQKMTRGDFPEIYELNLINNKGIISMIYLYPLDSFYKIFQIEHNILKENKWESILVDQVRISQVLNPIKVVNNEVVIFLAYYYENQICLKTFNIDDLEWKESIVLTDNKEKLYLDFLHEDGRLHLVYSEAVDGNYVIKYKAFKEDPSLVEMYGADVSRKSNSSNPTLILNDGLLWTIWNESSRIYSRVSNNKGETWGEIKSWEGTVNKKIVRYKYISNEKRKDRILHNSFGTIYPEIRFVGFE